jgi:hypothetical protein
MEPELTAGDVCPVHGGEYVRWGIMEYPDGSKTQTAVCVYLGCNRVIKEVPMADIRRNKVEMGEEFRTEEGQGSDLLRELAKIELQAAVGNELVKRVGDRFAEYALSSPGNLRLCRTLLIDRSLDETGFQVTVGEDVEDWVVEGADDSLQILDLWNLLLDAEKDTILEGALEGRVWDAGRALAVTEVQRVFVELEIKLESYKIVHNVEGHNRLSQEIVKLEERRENEDYPHR